MNKWKPGCTFVYLLAVVFVKVADSEMKKNPTACSDDGIVNVYIYF